MPIPNIRTNTTDSPSLMTWTIVLPNFFAARRVTMNAKQIAPQPDRPIPTNPRPTKDAKYYAQNHKPKRNATHRAENTVKFALRLRLQPPQQGRWETAVAEKTRLTWSDRGVGWSRLERKGKHVSVITHKNKPVWSFVMQCGGTREIWLWRISGICFGWHVCLRHT